MSIWSSSYVKFFKGYLNKVKYYWLSKIVSKSRILLQEGTNARAQFIKYYELKDQNYITNV